MARIGTTTTNGGARVFVPCGPEARGPARRHRGKQSQVFENRTAGALAGNGVDITRQSLRTFHFAGEDAGGPHRRHLA